MNRESIRPLPDCAAAAARGGTPGGAPRPWRTSSSAVQPRRSEPRMPPGLTNQAAVPAKRRTG